MNKLTKENLPKIEKDMVNFLINEIKENCPQIPEENNITLQEFKQKYANNNKPVILKNVTSNWSAQKLWNFDYFADRFSEHEVSVDLYNAKKTRSMKIKSFIESLNNATVDNPTYLQEWWFHHDFPELLNEFEIPEYFVDDMNKTTMGYYNSTLWIGSAGSFTPIHQDSVYTNVWTAQIRGKKEWIVFDKNAILKQKENGEFDYDEFLKNPNNNVMHYDLSEGDILYLPYKWWHRAITIEPSISVNTFYVSEEIIQRYIQGLFAIPISTALNKDLLIENDPRRYNINIERIKLLCKVMGLNPENVLDIEVKKVPAEI